jgi:hypothetical protein
MQLTHSTHLACMVSNTGMTKTLQVYEPQFIEMIEEAMKSGEGGAHKLMATAVLEPYTGQEGGAEGAIGPGNFVGGDNFMITCGCMVKVSAWRTRDGCIESGFFIGFSSTPKLRYSNSAGLDNCVGNV